MSRVAKAPVELPKGVEFKQDGGVVTLKGGNGELSLELNSEVELKQEDNVLTLHPRSGSRFSTAIAGTMRAILANMAKGVSEGFEKKLELQKSAASVRRSPTRARAFAIPMSVYSSRKRRRNN